jgi:acetylornithine deacetylase
MTQSPDDVHHETLRILERLVAFDTVSDRSNLALIDWVEAHLAGHGLAARRFPNAAGDKAALVVGIGPADRPGIVLSGHTDVVPVAGQQWTSDPFALRIAEGRAFARGAVDMKGFVALALAHVPLFRDAGLRRPVHIVVSYDEETTCLGSCDAIAAFGRDMPLPIAAIVGEPTSMEVADAHKSVVTFDTTVTGREAHSAKPGLGANAVTAAARLVCELDRLADEFAARGDPTGRFDPPNTTIHVGRIEGGTARNIVPKRAWFEWEFRGVPGLDADEIPARFAAFAEGEVLPTLRAGAGGDATILTRLGVHVPGLAPEPGSTAETLALRLAGRNRTISVPYATEAGHFQAAGIPTVVCGPGSIDQAHQPDEFISLDQLRRGADFMRGLAAWCAAG